MRLVDHRQSGQQRDRLEPDHDGGVDVSTGIQRVGQKEEVEFAALRSAGDSLQQSEVLGTGLCLRQPPATDMMAAAEREDTEMHLAELGHGG